MPKKPSLYDGGQKSPFKTPALKRPNLKKPDLKTPDLKTPKLKEGWKPPGPGHFEQVLGDAMKNTPKAPRPPMGFGRKAAIAGGAAALLAGTGATALALRPKKNVEKNMSASAFGVDHGDVSKAATKKDSWTGGATTGRLATGALLGPYHGLAAGKKGHKLRAAGNEFGGGILGSMAGGAAGALTRNPQVAMAGSQAGGYAGKVLGTARAQRKGHFKPQPKGAM